MHRIFPPRYRTVGYVLERYFGYLVMFGLLVYQRHMAGQAALYRRAGDAALALQGAVTRMETAQRGYLYVGDDSYLDDYSAEQHAYPERYRLLVRLLAGDDVNLNRASHVDALARQKIAEMDSTIAEYRGGNKAGALRIVETNVGRNYMMQLRQIVNDIRTDKQIQEIAHSSSVE